MRVLKSFTSLPGAETYNDVLDLTSPREDPLQRLVSRLLAFITGCRCDAKVDFKFASTLRRFYLDNAGNAASYAQVTELQQPAGSGHV